MLACWWKLKSAGNVTFLQDLNHFIWEIWQQLFLNFDFLQLKNGMKTSSPPMLILSPPATSTAHAVGFLCCWMSHYLSVFPQTLFIHVCSPLLSSPPSLAVSSPPISDRVTTSFFFRHLSVSLLHLSFEATRSGRATDLLKTFSCKGLEAAAPAVGCWWRDEKKEHVNCGEKRRNFVFLLLSSAPRDDGGTFDVWRFHSFLCFPLVSSLLRLFHILFSLVCAVIFFLIPFFRLSFCVRRKKKLYFQKSELRSSSFQLCWTDTIKSQLSSSLNCSYSNLLCSPFLHLQ